MHPGWLLQRSQHKLLANPINIGTVTQQFSMLTGIQLPLVMLCPVWSIALSAHDTISAFESTNKAPCVLLHYLCWGCQRSSAYVSAFVHAESMTGLTDPINSLTHVMAGLNTSLCAHRYKQRAWPNHIGCRAPLKLSPSTCASQSMPMQLTMQLSVSNTPIEAKKGSRNPSRAI